ncbi:MAG: hypothetical protein Kow00114_13970 [Kiloniellaceae bacterium]
MRNSTKRRFETAGWVLFIVSAVFFIWASWRAGDLLALAGSVFFFLACFVFLVPLHGHRVPDEERPRED